MPALNTAQPFGKKEFGALRRVAAGTCEVAVGNTPKARQDLGEGLSQSDDRDTGSAAVVLLAWTGDEDGAQKLIGKLTKNFPTDTLLNKGFIPMAKASSEIHRGQPAQALAELESAKPYEVGGGLLF